MMKKHGLFILVILLVFVVASLSMPVMAEKMIQDAQDKVVTQQDSAAAERAALAKKNEAKAPELIGHPVSDAAMAALESAAREAYAKTFGESIPDSYKAVKADAYEEEGDMRFFLSLMPADWKESTDALAQQEKRPYYAIDFGGVDPQTGAGSVIGLQKFWLGGEVQELTYTSEQLESMEKVARSFATDHGFSVGELVKTDKVTGSFGTGCVMVLALPDGKTVSVTVMVDGSVSGYSLVESKG